MSSRRSTSSNVIDTHCHLNFDAFDADRAEVLQRARDAGVGAIINPAIDVESGSAAIALAQEYPGIYAAVGIHPNSSAATDADYLSVVAEQSKSPKVVAIGEIGLDYHWDFSPKDVQWRAFEAQLELAARLELPVIIHNREASDDVIAILERWCAALPASLQSRPGVLHSFSAPPAIADRALAINFCLGFTGPITYKKADELRRIAARTPVDRLLVETDAPYLTPTPHRGKRNEPAYIPLMVDRLAALHGLTRDEMARQTTANAIRLFNLPPQ
ncbi:MAG: TatD family hydrolase [Chloroflexi bacterium]|nr:TatD family hydrolase [Chloroflexota bacterium]